MQASRNNRKRRQYQREMAEHQRKLAQYEEQTRAQWHQRPGYPGGAMA